MNLSQKQINLCRDVLLPTIQQAYVLVYENQYGEDVAQWSYLGKHEFGPVAPYHLPDKTEELLVLSVQQKKLPWISKETRDVPFGILVGTPTHQVLAFRGTVVSIEWIQNSLFLQKSFSLSNEVKVHAGFLETHNSLWKRFKDQLEALLNPSLPLIITGHSLGGAVAQLMALELAALQPVVYTFGSPRVGNLAFVQHYNRTVKKSYRIVNGFDPVPALPPKLVLEKGKELYKHTKNEVSVYASVESLNHWRDLTHPDVLASHLPSTYLKALSHTLEKTSA